MAFAQFTQRLGFLRQRRGANRSRWGISAWNSIRDTQDEAIAGAASVSGTVTSLNGATNQARRNTLILVGADTTIPQVEKVYSVFNDSGVNATIGTSIGVKLTLPPNGYALVVCDGTDTRGVSGTGQVVPVEVVQVARTAVDTDENKLLVVRDQGSYGLPTIASLVAGWQVEVKNETSANIEITTVDGIVKPIDLTNYFLEANGFMLVNEDGKYLLVKSVGDRLVLSPGQSMSIVKSSTTWFALTGFL